MTFGQEAPSPSRFPPNMPPLPGRTPSSHSIDAVGSERGSAELGAVRHSVAPTAVDGATTHPALVAAHHGLSALAAVILLAGAAVVATPVLLSQRGELDGPEPAAMPLVEPPSLAANSEGAGKEVDTAIFEQFIQLDEVLVTATAELRQENTPAEEVADR